MAGKKRRGRAGYKARYAAYLSGKHKEKNKEAKQLRHSLRTERIATRVAEKEELLEKVKSKYNLDVKGLYALKRLIGTVNISRLSSMLNGSITEQQWFIDRMSKINPSQEAIDASDGKLKPAVNALKVINNTKLRVFV